MRAALGALMATYAKLSSSIIHSSLWRSEPPATRIVWVTMLAMADRDGIVEAALPGLSAAANVTLDEVEAALLSFASPDKYSRTPDHDGRRIEQCDGGWRLINYERYRELNSADDMRAKAKDRAKRYRDRHASSRDVTLRDVTVTVLSTSGSGSGADQAQIKSEQIAADAATFEALWAGCSRKGGKAEARKAWVKAGKPAAEDVIARWAKYVASLEEWRNPKDVATWFNKGTWLEEYVPYVKPGSNGHVRPAPESFAARDERERQERAQRAQEAARRERESAARSAAIIAEADAALAARKAGA